LPTPYAKPLVEKALEWQCRSNSSFRDGVVVGWLTYVGSYRWNFVWDIVKWQYGFVGVEWKKASDHPELIARFAPQVWKKGLAAHGENWHGNWVGSAYETRFAAPPLAPPTQHERLEAALTLREFLADKMPADKLKAWIQDALHQA